MESIIHDRLRVAVGGEPAHDRRLSIGDGETVELRRVDDDGVLGLEECLVERRVFVAVL